MKIGFVRGEQTNEKNEHTLERQLEIDRGEIGDAIIPSQSELKTQKQTRSEWMSWIVSFRLAQGRCPQHTHPMIVASEAAANEIARPTHAISDGAASGQSGYTISSVTS